MLGAQQEFNESWLNDRDVEMQDTHRNDWLSSSGANVQDCLLMVQRTT